MMRRLTACAFFIILLLQVLSVQSTGAGSGFYDYSGKNKYSLKYSYEITNKSKSTAITNVRVRFLMAADSNSPYQISTGYTSSQDTTAVQKDPAGNIFGEVTYKKISPGESKIINTESVFENGSISFYKSIYKLTGDYSEFTGNPQNLQYLKPSIKIESDSPEIIQKAGEFDPNKLPAARAKEIYDYVNLNIEYDQSPRYANKGALSAFTTKRGVCEDFSDLFTALCRAAGIPARVVYGYMIDNELKSDVPVKVSGEGHAWAEFFLPGAGWVPVDPTYNYTVDGKQVVNDHYFASLKSSKHFISSYYADKLYNMTISYSYEIPAGQKPGTFSKPIVEQRINGQTVQQQPAMEGSIKSFDDISGCWARQYIERLYNSGVVFAKKGSLFKPDNYITRAEFISFTVLALRMKVDATNLINTGYRDVSADSRFAPFVSTALKTGLINSNGGLFKPDEKLTRQDAAVIIYRALQMSGKKYDAGLSAEIGDIGKISPDAVNAVKLVNNLGIIGFKTGSLFEPKGYITRARASEFICKLLDQLGIE